jgi:hypothetical protein
MEVATESRAAARDSGRRVGLARLTRRCRASAWTHEQPAQTENMREKRLSVIGRRRRVGWLRQWRCRRIFLVGVGRVLSCWSDLQDWGICWGCSTERKLGKSTSISFGWDDSRDRHEYRLLHGSSNGIEDRCPRFREGESHATHDGTRKCRLGRSEGGVSRTRRTPLQDVVAGPLAKPDSVATRPKRRGRSHAFDSPSPGAEELLLKTAVSADVRPSTCMLVISGSARTARPDD